MNEMLKKSSKTLYIVCSCIIVLMFISYLGLNNTKNTYSAFSCPTGYSFNGTNCSMTISAKYSQSKVGQNAPCTYGGSGIFSTCKIEKTENDDGEIVSLYNCSATCTVAYSQTDDPACYKANHRYLWSNTNPGGSYVKVSGITKEKCSGCESGYIENNEGDCVQNAGSCYIANYRYLWSNTYPGSPYEKVSGITKDKCSGCKSGYTENNNGDCVAIATKCIYSPIANSDGKDANIHPGHTCEYVNISIAPANSPNTAQPTLRTKESVQACCQSYGWTFVASNFSQAGDDHYYCIRCGSSNPGGSSGNSGGGSSTKPSNPSTTPSGSTPKPSSSTPSSSSNITENPKTGTVAILIVWIIALGTLAYSFVYFRQLNKNKK